MDNGAILQSRLLLGLRLPVPPLNCCILVYFVVIFYFVYIVLHVESSFFAYWHVPVASSIPHMLNGKISIQKG